MASRQPLPTPLPKRIFFTKGIYLFLHGSYFSPSQPAGTLIVDRSKLALQTKVVFNEVYLEMNAGWESNGSDMYYWKSDEPWLSTTGIILGFSPSVLGKRAEMLPRNMDIEIGLSFRFDDIPISRNLITVSFVKNLDY